MNLNEIDTEANRLLAERIGRMVIEQAAGEAQAMAMLSEIERLQNMAAKPPEGSEGKA